MNYRYDFSLIMPVYGVEAYLAEAVDSCLNQTYPPEKVQIILIDDGSPDRSGEICDAYAAAHPDRIKVIHQENQRVGAARMAGLTIAEGKYIGFLDSDDSYSPDVLAAVWDFFEAHGNEVDVVTIPMRYFGLRDGEPMLSRMADQGTRVIDLYREWQCPVLGINHAFYRHETAAEMDIDRKLICAEDSKENIRLLLNKMKLGVISGVWYHYRILGMGLTAKRYRDLRWFTESFVLYHDWAHRISMEKRGELPLYVQYMLITDLAARLRQEEILCPDMDERARETYRRRVAFELSRLDDQALLSRTGLVPVLTAYAFELKYGQTPQRLTDHRYGLPNQPWGRMDGWTVHIDRVRVTDGLLMLQGMIELPHWLRGALPELRIGGQSYPVRRWTETCPIRSMGVDIGTRYGWSVAVALDAKPIGRLEWMLKLPEGEAEQRHISFYRTTAWADAPSEAFAADRGIALMKDAQGLKLVPCKPWRKEIRLAHALIRRNGRQGLRTAALRVMAQLMRPLMRKPIWVLQDEYADGLAAELAAAMPKRAGIKPVLLLPKGTVSALSYLPIGGFRAELNRLLSQIDLRGDDRTAFIDRTGCLEQLAGGSLRVWLGGVMAEKHPQEVSKQRLGFDAVLTALPQDTAIWRQEGYAAEAVRFAGLPRRKSGTQGFAHKQSRLVFCPACPLELWADRELWNPGCAFRLRKDADRTAQVGLFRRLLGDGSLCDFAAERGTELALLAHPRLRGQEELYRPDARIAVESATASALDAAWIVTDDARLEAEAKAAGCQTLLIVPQGSESTLTGFDQAYTAEDAAAWIRAALSDGPPALESAEASTDTSAEKQVEQMVAALKELAEKGCLL